MSFFKSTNIQFSHANMKTRTQRAWKWLNLYDFQAVLKNIFSVFKYRLYLNKKWFLQDLEKDFIRTIIHTTLNKWITIDCCLFYKHQIEDAA
jgi:hypothetical protein